MSQPSHSIRIEGAVLDDKERRPLPGLKVSARSGATDKELGHTTTGPSGDFALQISLAAHEHDHADIYLTVDDGPHQLYSGKNAAHLHGPAALVLEVAGKSPAPAHAKPPTIAPASPVVGQVVDENGGPLAGYLVRLLGTDRTVLAETITNGVGIFSLLVKSAPSSFRAVLEIHARPGSAVLSTTTVDVPQPEPIRVRVHAPAPLPSATIEQLAHTAGVTLPAALGRVLSTHGIRSAADLAGGKVASIALSPDAKAALSRLQAHARLATLSPDAKLSAGLIARGFASPLAIAQTSRPSFVQQAKDLLDPFTAAQLHQAAVAQTDYLNARLAEQLVAAGNGAPSAMAADLAEWIPPRCACDDCEAAVSPAAYLADLMNYALLHLRDQNGVWLPLGNTLDKLLQPFPGLLTDCEAVHREVRQVRLCIEVLRALLAASGATESIVDYLAATYEQLLVQIGTSSAEIRLARTATPSERAWLAERLGFSLSPSRPDELDALYLDPAATLDEATLEALFGLQDTSRPPLNDGITLNDAQGQLLNWTLSGAEWRVSTDDDGRIYVNLSRTAPNTYQIDLFKDAARTQLVATSGSFQSVFNRPAVASRVNGTNLDATMMLNYVSDSSTIVWRALPRLTAFRLRLLRADWVGEDRPVNAFSDPDDTIDPRDLLPVIDPDVLGPDDFRVPFVKLNAADPDQPFDLWLRRRQWIDGQLQALAALLGSPPSAPILPTLFAAMKQPITYGTQSVTPWPNDPAQPNLELLAEQLIDPQASAAAADAIAHVFYLPMEAFNRLLALGEKDQIGEVLEADEIADALSILVGAQKRALFAVWRTEESSFPSLLGPAHFCPTDEPPVTGVWPPAPTDSTAPLVDPDMKLASLAGPTVGRRARALWRARASELSVARSAIVAAHQANPTGAFDAMFGVALGPPPAVTPSQTWSAYVDSTYALMISGTNPAAVAQALTQVLFMTTDQFSRLVTLEQKYANPGAGAMPPTATEWGEVYAILTEAEKRKTKYPAWIAQENAIGLSYWEALRAALPPFRSDERARQLWTQALQARSAAPVIDPDVLLPAHIRNPVAGNAAFDLFTARQQELDAFRTALESLRTTAATQLDAFDAMLLAGGVGEFDGTNRTLAAVKARTTADRVSQGINFVLVEAFGAPLPDFKQLAQDLADPTKADAARHFIERELYLTVAQLQQLVAILQSPSPSPADLDALDSMLAQSMILRSILDTDATSSAGTAAARLAQLGLDAAAFDELISIWKLAGDDLVEDAEWQSLGDLLTAMQKRRRFALYRDAEKASTPDIVLSGEFFQAIEPDPTVFPPPQPPAPTSWRATARERASWESTLAARVDQANTVVSGVQAVASTVEAQTLPQLRALLLASAAIPSSEPAEWVLEHLFIDAAMDGCTMTTRVAQAIETVQDMLFAVRAGELPADLLLTLDAPNFEEEWKWIGSYSTWRSAMFVFLYPENILLPNLRPASVQTPVFRDLVDGLRQAPQVSPEVACELGKQYSRYFSDILNLVIDCTCQTTARVQQPVRCTDRRPLEERTVAFLFGHGPSGAVYWSMYDAAQPSDFAQSFWSEIGALTSVDVTRVLGAMEYQVASIPFLFLFMQTDRGGVAKVSFVRYDLQNGIWDAAVTDLDLPPGASVTDVVLKQVWITSTPPHIGIRLLDGTILERQLNTDATGWEGPDFRTVIAAPQSAAYTKLVAMIQYLDQGYYMCVRGADGLHYIKLFYTYDIPLYRLWSGAQHFVTIDRVERDGYLLKGWHDDGVIAYVSAVAVPSAVALRRFYRIGNTVAAPICALDTDPSTIQAYFNSSQGYQELPPCGWVRSGLQTGQHHLDGWYASADVAYTTSNAEEQTLPGLGYTPGIVLFDSTGYVTPNDDWIQLTKEFDGGFNWDQTVYVFLEAGGAVACRIDPTNHSLHAVYWGSFHTPLQPVIHSGYGMLDANGAITQFIGYTRTSSDADPGSFLVPMYRMPNGTLPPGPEMRAAPSNHITVSLPAGAQMPALVEITERLNDAELLGRRSQTEAMFQVNGGGPKSNLVYLEEAYYFVPMQLALALQGGGQYLTALDWFRTVWDYSISDGNPKIYYGLVLDAAGPGTSFVRPDDWLLDPLNPHAIAEVRSLTYNRFTLESLIQCFIAYADAEFTSDTPESVPRARMLYLMAARLLARGELWQGYDDCEQLIGEITIDIGIPLFGFAALLKRALRQIGNLKLLRTTVEAVKAALAADGSPMDRMTTARKLVEAARAQRLVAKPFGAIVTERREALEHAHQVLAADPVIRGSLTDLDQSVRGRFAQAVTRASGISIQDLATSGAKLAWLGEAFGRAPKINSADLAFAALSKTAPQESPSLVIDERYVPPVAYSFCVPPNPILKSLSDHVQLALYNIRNCRNIAGLLRQLPPYAAATDTTSGLPSISGGALVLPAATSLPPIPYRYQTLIELARQLVTAAQQVEGSMLSALEKRDAELYSLLRARQDLNVAQAQVQLNQLSLQQALDQVTQAQLQQQRAQLTKDYYTQWLQQPISDLEQASLAFMATSIALDAASGVASGIQGSAGGALSGFAAAASESAALTGTLASFERRQQAWQMQQSQAQQDIQLAVQQGIIAQDQVRIAAQQMNIANLQVQNDSQTIDFLTNKFTSAELYDWMSGVLGRVYATLLQRATSVARLAANQLAFERQQQPPVTIAEGYWTPPSDQTSAGATGPQPDRNGLTGAERLLSDIEQLDVYAVESNQRKLQISKVLSLASLSPIEFAQFQQTGVLRFATTLDMFDRDFPGHYVRLIRRVRATVVALIPPAIGIRATLSVVGPSRVVVSTSDGFQQQIVPRPPESVVFSSPLDATGVFELDPQSELLLPFEGLGVAANWEFSLPRAANPFDFASIADVLITIDYMALGSDEYRQQVIALLDERQTGERPFSFQNDLADSWYDLSNPDQTATPMTVTFETLASDFPPNLDELQIEQVALYFSRADGVTMEIDVNDLSFKSDSSSGFTGGPARTVDGVISTRSGNAGAWIAIIGKSVAGTWRLSLPNSDEVRSLFTDGEINDILLVVTYAGITPDWAQT